jgi:hypothetical protein
MLRLIVLAYLLSGLMMSLYLAHIHITSHTFIVSNVPGGFMSGLIRSCITYVTRTGEALLNGPTSPGRNIRRIFCEPKVLCSCPRRSIMQCNMHNQCTMYDSHGVELCTMYDSHSVYLCVLWTICMYKFSRCHAIIFHGFFFPLTNFRQNSPGFWQNSSGNCQDEFQENHRFIGEVGR